MREQFGKGGDQRHADKGLEDEFHPHAFVAKPVERQVDGKEHPPERRLEYIRDEQGKAGGLTGDKPHVAQHHHGKGAHGSAKDEPLGIFEQGVVFGFLIFCLHEGLGYRNAAKGKGGGEGALAIWGDQLAI